jgi:signal transduction histidine kinase
MWQPELRKQLWSQRQTIAGVWFDSVTFNGGMPISGNPLAQALSEVTEDLIDSLFREPFEPHLARQAGAAMYKRVGSTASFLSQSQAVLGTQIAAAVPTEDLPALLPRLNLLIAEVGYGFFNEFESEITPQGESAQDKSANDDSTVLESLNRSKDELVGLHQALVEINAELELSKVLEIIVHRAAVLTGTKMGEIWLLDPENDRILRAAAYNWDEGIDPLQLEIGEGVAGRVVQMGSIINIANYSEWEGRVKDAALKAKRILGVPLARGSDVFGALSVFDVDAIGPFKENKVMLLNLFAARAAVAVENARLFDQVTSSRVRLQDLSRRLVEIQETSRRELARELHDEIGQVLTGLDLMLKGLKKAPGVPQDQIGAAEILVEELSNRVTSLSLTLYPAILEDLGLLPALISYINNIQKLTGIKINFEHTGLKKRFDLRIETTVYRVIQEALTNVTRHGQTDTVILRIWANRDSLSVQIEDQGVGFIPAQILSSGKGSGLTGIQERVFAVGGTVEIDSSPGIGTTILVILPIQKNKEN